MMFKFPVFVFFFGFLHAAHSFPSVHADFNTCQKRFGNFPKPGSSCRAYYKCRNWKAKEMMCPQDQHFFPAKSNCVWPEEYPCLEKPVTKECPLPDGQFLKRGTKCKMYYRCRKGVPTEKKCDGELLFDTIKSSCEWPELVTCPEDVKSEKCPQLNGKFLRPGTGCKIFYDCDNGIATERKCPRDQLFDPDKQKCEWPEIYTCVEEPKSKECQRPNGKFLRPGTGCRIFYDCRNGIATERRCPEDQLFDPVEKKCEWPEIYTCIEDITPSQSTPITETTPHGTSTKKYITTTTILPVSSTRKRPTTDSDENSSEEGKSSEEGNSSEEDRRSSTTFKNKDTTSSTETSPKFPSTTTTVAVTPTSTAEDTPTASTKTGLSTDDCIIYDKISYSEIISEESTPPTKPIEIKGTDSTTMTSGTSNSPTLIVTDTIVEDTPTTSTKKENSTDNYIQNKTTQSEIVYESTPPTTPLENQSTESTTITSGITDSPTFIITNTNGEETSTKTTTSDVTDSVTLSIFCPKPNGYFPHPNNRYKFVACVGGIPTVMDCPANLVYDHETRACDYDTKGL